MHEEVDSDMTSRLALGTAQLGLRYGVANTVGQVPRHAAYSILERAAQAGIDTLDTAIAYGDSEACLGEYGVADWHVITKLPALPNTLANVETWVESQVVCSLERLRIPRLGALLLHRPMDLLGERGPQLLQALHSLRQGGLFEAIGVSIYAPDELDRLWKVFRPDLVQVPLNVLDRRLIHTGWLDRLHKVGVRVHIRSVFLQGLLLMSAQSRPDYFQPWRELLDAWSAWCCEHRCSALRSALGFALAQKGVERVIVGVDSISQLEDILEASAQPPLPLPDLYSDNLKLLEPSRWMLK
ncbi:aldo/keto reductase [Methylobacillus sp. MM3]|uniref:aldo/keto reductase n=1 Tax=Methylobacillus sp. MM3 TaxID=1848039 RepID=UPI001969F59D|nr:aldo/keto reductase [Methylobacillus sp. MM3]